MRPPRLDDPDCRAAPGADLLELDAIYGSASVGLILLDRDLRVVRINETLARINGFSVEEHLGRVIWDLVPDLRLQAEPLFRRILDQGEVFENVAISGETPDQPGVQRHWIEHFYPVRDTAGRIAGLGALCQEVTAQKRAETALRDSEAQLRRLNAELEARVVAAVEERSKVLAQLHESQKLESIGQLTGGVAHDFNNLLSAVMSNLTLLRKRAGDDGRALRLIDGAMQGAERGAALTRRLLAFARRQNLRAETVSIGDLVDGMHDLLARSLGPHIRIETAVPQGLPPVTADANQLELAILNLAVNARDAMPAGGTLTLAASAVDVAHPADAAGAKPGPYVLLSVRDTGLGMDPETLRRAAEPFFTTKVVGQGTGLGLSTVQGLALQSGGAMRLESTPGWGTTVTLWLPQAEGGAAAASPGSGGTAPLRTRLAKILVVDDDALVGMGTVEMLEDLGYPVVEAASGPQALRLLAEHPDIGLVLTDHGMPGMTGLDLARRVQTSRPGLPVVLTTGYADLPESAGLPKLGKPFTQDELARTVADVLRAPYP